MRQPQGPCDTRRLETPIPDAMDDPLPSFHPPLVAILRGVTVDDVEAHVDALLAEGFGAIEIPTNSPGWDRSVALAVAACGDRARVGAGTVLESAHLDALQAAGGELVVRVDAPLEGVAPGQTAVVYVGTRVMGQCTIDRTVSAVPVSAS